MRSIPAIAIVVLASLVVACGPARTPRGDTEIVAQWSPPRGAPARALIDAATQLTVRIPYQMAAIRIGLAGGSLYSENGNDSGGGLFNVYLKSHKADQTVARLVSLARAGRLPPGMRIGVAVYLDRAHTDWNYRGVYPPGLAYFSQSYASAAEECAMWRFRKEADPNLAGPRGLGCAASAGPPLALP